MSHSSGTERAKEEKRIHKESSNRDTLTWIMVFVYKLIKINIFDILQMCLWAKAPFSQGSPKLKVGIIKRLPDGWFFYL